MNSTAKSTVLLLFPDTRAFLKGKLALEQLAVPAAVRHKPTSLGAACGFCLAISRGDLPRLSQLLDSSPAIQVLDAQSLKPL